MEKASFGTLTGTSSKAHSLLFPILRKKLSLGQLKDGKANGHGVYFHVNGGKYEGHWKDDLQDGYGVETWCDGSSYEGYYKEGKKHGEGKFILPGIWENGKIAKCLKSGEEGNIEGKREDVPSLIPARSRNSR